MKKLRQLFAILTLSIPMLGCIVADISEFLREVAPTGTASSGGLGYQPSEEPSVDIGSFNVVTYNIDGFPQWIGGNSNEATLSIANKLDALQFDIIVFQEVFTKTKHSIYAENSSTASYPYRSDHFRGTNVSFGDGLMRFSVFPFYGEEPDFIRTQWVKCSGDLFGLLLGLYSNPDCNTEKGFTMARTEINESLAIDVYNLHNDAGGDEDSIDAKAQSMAQLADHINTVSADNVVIVAGDFNLGWSDNAEHRAIVETFLADSGITFACVETTGDLDSCNNDFDFPDHIGYKNNDEYRLTVLTLEHVEGLTDNEGVDLSDHKALIAEFAWEKR